MKNNLGNAFNGIERMTGTMLPLQNITMNDPAEKKIELMVVAAKIILHSLQNTTLCRINDFLWSSIGDFKGLGCYEN